MNEPVYYPNIGEFLFLLLFVLVLLLAGRIIKLRWSSIGESVPIPVALLMWLGMLVAFSLVVSSLYFTNIPAQSEAEPLDLFGASTPEPDRRFMLFYWSLLFFTVPVAYYTYTVVNSFATRTVDAIDPFSAVIEDPSEFAAARKMALRGDVDGAVAMYRSYRENTASAMFEAARLLRSDDRNKEAAALFEEIAERFHDNRRYWSEAVYQKARLYEVNLNRVNEAKALYRMLLERCPETQFARLAIDDLSRLNILTENVLDNMLHADTHTVDSRNAEFQPDNMEEETPEEADVPIPDSDPFFKPVAEKPVSRKTVGKIVNDVELISGLAAAKQSKPVSPVPAKATAKKKPVARKPAPRKKKSS